MVQFKEESNQVGVVSYPSLSHLSSQHSMLHIIQILKSYIGDGTNTSTARESSCHLVLAIIIVMLMIIIIIWCNNIIHKIVFT